MTEPRVNKTIKVDPPAVESVQELADAEQRTWSAMARILLAEAIEARRRTRVQGHIQGITHEDANVLWRLKEAGDG